MPHISLGPRSQAGFGVIALAVVTVVIGLLVGAFLRIAGSSLETTRTEARAMSEVALEAARDALVAWAAANNGCLPFAADFEGGLPDTDSTGAATAGYADTGNGVAPKQAGDLPWANLGLGPDFLDGNGLRIQYYVASAYTGTACAAGFRGFAWNKSVTYDGTTQPLLVYYNAPDGIALAQTPAGAGLLNLDGRLVVGVTASFDMPRRVTITSSGDESKRTFTIDGTDGKGKAIQDKISGPDTGIVASKKSFLTVTQVAISDAASGNIRVGAGPLLYKIVDTMPAGTSPDTFGEGDPDAFYADLDGSRDVSVGDERLTAVGVYTAGSIVAAGQSDEGTSLTFFDVTAPLPYPLLEVRLGPDVTTGAGKALEIQSTGNVFVLIAPGGNRNAVAGRTHVRDSNHVSGFLGTPWPLDLTGNPDEKTIIDTAIFSASLNTDPADEGNDGDDTLLVMRVTDFKAELGKYGLNMEAVCDDSDGDGLC